MKPLWGYVLLLVIGMFIIWGINSFFISPLIALLLTVGGVAIILALDAFIAWLIHTFPEKWFNHNKKIFRVNKRERKFYEKIGIRKWKDKVPEMGQLCDFKKDKIASTDKKYIEKFLAETGYAEIIHIAMILIGFLIIPIFPLKYLLTFSVPLIFLNTFLNLPPVLIQRYTRPKLVALYERELRQKQKSVAEGGLEVKKEEVQG